MSRLAYYVYYRVRADTGGARERVHAMQAELAAALEVSARLLVKRGEPELWMEVYEDIADSGHFEQALAAAVERHHLREMLRPDSVRHVECFTVPPECA